MKVGIALVFLTVLLAGCGGTNPLGDSNSHGVVTAKIRPSGAVGECQLYCDESGNYFRIVVEAAPGEKDMGGGWYEKDAYVCVPPSYFNKVKIGDRWTGRGDLHCDG